MKEIKIEKRGFKGKIRLLFLYEKIKNKKNINQLLKEFKLINGIGYGGYKDKIALKKFLLWAIFDEKDNRIKYHPIDKEDCIRLTKEIFYKTPEIDFKNIYLFILPTFNKFYSKKLNGIGGYCTWENCIFIFIDPIKGWKKNFKINLAHELAHAVSPFYLINKTILDWLVLDGLAENFQENINKKKSQITKAISKKRAMKIFIKIKEKLNTDDEQLHRELFYENKKYPLWAGYSIGYHIVKEYLKKQKNIDWNKIIKIQPKIILNESGFCEPITNKEAKKEHEIWRLKQKKLLGIAKKIYLSCKNKHEKIYLEKINNQIYDLMCENCWDKFRKKSSKH